MELAVAPDIERDADLAARVRLASDLLGRSLGPSSGQVLVSWAKSSDDRGRTILNLTISDWTGAVAYPFRPEELTNDLHLKLRFHRLWGDFLLVRSHTQLDSPFLDPAQA